MEKELILLVHTSGHAFSIEKALKKRGISCRLTPIPRKVSSDCGICVRFDAGAEKTVREFVRTLPFEIRDIIEPESVEK